jgi:hypothetical protein
MMQRNSNSRSKGKKTEHARIVQLLRAVEDKFHDVVVTPVTVGNSGTVLSSSLCIIPAGDGSSERDGRKVLLTRLSIRGLLSCTAESTTLTDIAEACRIIIYLDKQCNGAAAAATDIVSSADILSFKNLTNDKRFSILYDKVFELCPYTSLGDTTTFTTVPRRVHFEHDMKLNLPVLFDASAAAITDLTSNNIGVLGFSEAGGNVTCAFIARVRFIDP